MIERVVLDPPGLVDEVARALDPELRTWRLGPDAPRADGVVVLETDLARWGDPAWDPGPFDWSVGDRAWIEPVWLRARAPAGARADEAAGLLERVLSRLQRFVERRNEASAGPCFERVLRRHRALHDRRLPLVRVDHDHAVDTWRWVLRLRPDASMPLQLAALFHDVERLKSEARERREHRAADHDAFKLAHARAGALMTRRALASAGVDPRAVAEVEALVAEHESPRGGASRGDGVGESDPEERALLNDADALSFFSLNASGFLDYYGPAHTRTKIAYTLRRLRPEHHRRLCRLHLRADVLALLAEQLPRVGEQTTRRSA